MSWVNKHQHNWYCVKVYHYLDISYNVDGAESTIATFICVGCGKTKQESFYAGGYITKEDFNEAFNASCS